MIPYSHVLIAAVVLQLLPCDCSTSKSKTSNTFKEPLIPISAGYQPKYIVSDYDAIDLDVQEIDLLLEENNFDAAMQIYRKGGNTRPYAELTLDEPLTEKIIAQTEAYTYMEVNDTTKTGSSFWGTNKKASATTFDDLMKNRMYGTVMTTAKQGSTKIQLLYKVPKDCRVGAKQQSVLDRCFPSEGNLTFEGYDNYEVSYAYNPNTDNKNDRAIATFSTKAYTKMKPCNNCEYYYTFAKFVRFYGGKTDYADQFISNAAAGTETVLGSAGVFDFSLLNETGRAAAMQTAIITMNMIMFLIRELEHGNDECHNCQTESCHETIVKDVDSAQALFAGSLEGADGNGQGKLLFSFGDTECKYFKTCGSSNDKTTGVAYVNLRLTEHFQTMQQNLTDRACTSARSEKDRIAKLLFLPLIQRTLRYAYIRSKQGSNTTDEVIAVGATVAASVAPLVSACSYHDAAIITNNMQLSKSVPTNFDDVRTAFMNHFDCLGISCHDVGGLWDAENRQYYEDFEPCHIDDPPEDKHNDAAKWGVMSGILAVGLVLLCCAVYRLRKSRQRKKSRKIKSSSSPYHDDEDDDDDDDDSSDSSDLSDFRIS